MALTFYLKTPGSDKESSVSMKPIAKASRVKIPAGSKVIVLDENHNVVTDVKQETVNGETYITAKSGEQSEAVSLESDGSGAYTLDSDVANWPGLAETAAGSAFDSSALLYTAGIVGAVGGGVAALAKSEDTLAPTITSGSTATAIAENTAAGAQVYVATATDNKPTVTYSLKAGSDAGLSINASTGAVTLAGSPNFEVKDVYSFTVVATDAKGNLSEKLVTLNISNRDEVAPTISSGATAKSVESNSGAGQVVYTAAATDTDFVSPATANSITYSLKANSDAGLTINATTGAVTLTDNPNNQVKAAYSFTVVATDAAGNASEKAVALNITQSDHVAPTISSGPTAQTINENSGAGQLIYTAAATDTDFVSPATANSITYSLKGGSDAGLAINPTTGAVTLTGNPNFEAKSAYSFTVVATDAAGNASEQPVSLNIGNLDDTAPTISSGATAATVAENSGAGQVVYTASANDTDFISPATAS